MALTSDRRVEQPSEKPAGAERSKAVEAAIKTARAYHQVNGDTTRHELITFNNAFHGRTLATISASNQEKMHKGFMPLLPGFKYVDFDDLEGAKAAIGPNTAGFLVEPVQGEWVVEERAGDLLGVARAGEDGVADLAEVLRDEGFIKDFVVHQDGPQGAITVLLKYSADREPAISDIKRVSKPGLRRYVSTDEIPRVLNGMGIAILSTSKGVMVDREARKQQVGGELICTVW